MNPNNETENKNNQIDSDKNTLNINQPAAIGTPGGDTTLISSPGEKPQKFGKKIKLIISLVLVSLIAVAGSVYFLMASDNDKTDNDVQQTVKKPIDVLRVGTQQGLVSEFYPHEDSTTNSGSISFVKAVFEGLIRYDENKKFVPLLAEKWTNPDDVTWVFTIKQNVKFHSGKTMTAQDVKDSLLAESPSVDVYDLKNVIKTVEVKDKKTVVVTTNNPDALFLNRLVNTFIFDTHGKEKYSSDNATGPFQLKPGTRLGPNELRLTQFANYHGPKPYVKEIYARYFDTDEDMIAAASKSELDVAYSLTSDEVEAINKSNVAMSTIDVLGAGATELQPMMLKTGSPIQKKAVRQALYLSIDPAKVLEASGFDGKVADQIVPDTVTGYDPSIKRPKLDRTAAKKLLSDAGYSNGLVLSVFYGPPSEPAIQEIGTQLQEIGVTLENHKLTSFAEFIEFTQTQKYDMSFSGNYSDLSEISDIVQTNLTKAGLYGAYDNPTVNDLLTKSAQEFDSTKRIKILQQISKAIMDDYAMMPFYSTTFKVMVRNGYSVPVDEPGTLLERSLARFYMQ